jgi:hypothetical protein
LTAVACDLEHLGDLRVGESQHIVQQQRGALTWRQELQRSHEGQADLLPADHLILGVLRHAQVSVANRL